MKDEKTTFTYDRGCIVRGPRDKKLIALEFTGGSFADGGANILEQLKKRNIKASFFFIGDFYRQPEFRTLIAQIRDEGHYLGPHSDKHPLYASWESPPKLLVTREAFVKDLEDNYRTMEKFEIAKDKARFFIPPYEHWTPEISAWSQEMGVVMINLTRGTKSHTDYMEDKDPKYVASPEIVKSIFEYEQKDPDGMNGFLLLMHIGAGPGRTRDHLYNYLGEILDELTRRGYQFVRVDELLKNATEKPAQ